MGCINCKDLTSNSCGDITSSDCTSWQGDAYTTMSICPNDSLTEVVSTILDKIVEISNGKNILLPDVNLTNCSFINTILGSQTKDLVNVINSIVQSVCTVNDKAVSNIASINLFSTLTDYTLGCLSPLVDPCATPATFKTLIQSIITKLCTLSAQYDSISASMLAIVEESLGNFLISGAIYSAGGNGLFPTGTGSTATIRVEALVPPNSPIVYIGSLSFFDSSGAGFVNTPYQGYFLCNGNNNTPLAASLPQNTGGTTKYIIRFT